jgi:hypothetical protein
MRRAASRARSSRFATVAALLALWTTHCLAQASSASFRIPRQSIDSGGGMATGASFAVQGTAGQPDAGTASNPSIGTLRGGFHPSGAAPAAGDVLFGNGFE